MPYAREQPRFLEGGGEQPSVGPMSEETARAIDNAVRALIARAFERATAYLALNRPVLEAAAQELLRLESLDEAALNGWAARLKALPQDTATGEKTG